MKKKVFITFVIIENKCFAEAFGTPLKKGKVL
jgi:hypothetical protein